MGNRGRPPLTPPSEELLARLDFYRDTLYRGNQRAMADALGVSESLVSKITKRVQRPSDAFLESLAGQPLVNREWLFFGQGQPLLPSTMGTLPVSDVILPGPPLVHGILLQGERYPVATRLERDTRYWLRLDSQSPLVRRPELKLAGGDLLLVETGRDHLDRPDVVDRQLCAIHVPVETGNVYSLARIVVESGTLYATIYASVVEGHAAGTDAERERFLDQVAKRRPRTITKRASRSKNKPAASSGHRESPELSPQSGGTSLQRLDGINDIVGMALLLQRPSVLTLGTNQVQR